MKNIIALMSLLVVSTTAYGQVPRELQDLIPVGSNGIRMAGRTVDNKDCTVQFSATATSFQATVAVLDQQGEVDSRRFGSFQIGRGHELQSLGIQGDNTVAVSLHKAGASYASDSRATLKVNKPGDEIRAVQIIVEEKGFFGFKTEVKEACIFTK